MAILELILTLNLYLLLWTFINPGPQLTGNTIYNKHFFYVYVCALLVLKIKKMFAYSLRKLHRIEQINSLVIASSWINVIMASVLKTVRLPRIHMYTYT